MPISVSNSLGKLVSANLTPVQRNIEESIQKLSTGARIHKGADDSASMHLASRFETKVKGLSFVDDVLVELVWDPIWNQDMMTEEAKLKLGMI